MLLEISGYFLIGLSGGFGHCMLMCNPLVIFISSKFSTDRVGYSILFPHILYNLGRIITYSLLGAIAGFFGTVIQYAGETFMNIQRLASILGGIFMLFYAAFYILSIKTNFLSKFNYLKIFKRFHFNNPFLYGILFGFLPCGLSMGAVIGASATANLLKSALLLFTFGLGTTVAMMLLALFGSYAMKYSSILRKVGVVFLIFMGAYFIYKGLIY